MGEGAKIRVNYFCLGAILIFVGSILLCALGITVVLPFEATRVWPEVTCTVLNSSYNPSVCSCDEQLNIYDKCISKYPCLQIFVSYSPKIIASTEVWDNNTSAVTKNNISGTVPLDFEATTGSNLQYTAVNISQTPYKSGDRNNNTLQENDSTLEHYGATSENSVSFIISNERTATPVTRSPLLDSITSEPPEITVGKLYRSWDDSFYRQCSLTECGDETWNIKESKRFRSDWGEVGQQFKCYYDPNRPTSLIIERIESTSAIHAIAWPASCLLVGVTLWIGLCIGCCSTQSENSSKDEYGPL